MLDAVMKSVLLLLVVIVKYTVQAPGKPLNLTLTTGNVTELVPNNTIAPILPQTNGTTASKEVLEAKKESVALKTVVETTLATIVEETTTIDKDGEEKIEEEEKGEQKPPTVEEEEKSVEEKKPLEKENPKSSSSQTKIDALAEPEDSNFLIFMLVGVLLVVCIYLLQHNKKKILGLMFEGRSSRRNVRYRRLSQRDDLEQYKDDIIY